MKIKFQNVTNLLIIFSISSFIFLWGYSYPYNFNYIILIHSLILIIFNFWKKNLKLFNNDTSIAIFLLIHFFIVAIIIQELNFQALKFIGVVFLISYFIYYNKNFIFDNLKLIIDLFLIIFFINIFYDIFYIGINQNFHLRKDFLLFPEKGYLDFQDSIFNCKYSYFRAEEKFNYLIFKEISHFGMIAPAVILAKVLFLKKENLISNLFLLLFCMFTILFFSTSLIFCLMISSVFFIFFMKKNMDLPKISILLSIIIFCTFTLIFNNSCNTKISDTLNLFKNNIDKFIFKSKKNDEIIVTVPKNLYENKNSKFYKWESKYFPNLSSAVLFNSFLISFEALEKSLIGFGFNNYEIASKLYFDNSSKKLKNIGKNGIDRIKNYNLKDGSNNLAKLIAEFGILSILLIFLVIKFMKNPNISPENKIFYITLFLSQLVRGAGYFNGGFIFAILIMISSLSIKKKND